MKLQQPKPIAFIRKLCAHKSEAEILEAEQNWRQYILLIKKICEDLEESHKLKE